MAMTRSGALLALAFMTVGPSTALAQSSAPRSLRRVSPVVVEIWGPSGAVPAADQLRTSLDAYDTAQAEALERLYRENGDAEKRLLERRFGLIDHRFRVSASPAGIYGVWERSSEDPSIRLAALQEIAEGRYAAYYFFDGVIRPNVFARVATVRRQESPVHEKIHLIQPALYHALGITCRWRSAADPCARSVEPVAVYLTEYAILKRSDPHRSDVSVNRAIERYLAQEEDRCRTAPASRCATRERLQEYVTLPRALAREVERRGLEEGLRRFIRALAAAEVVATTGG